MRICYYALKHNSIIHSFCLFLLRGYEKIVASPFHLKNFITHIQSNFRQREIFWFKMFDIFFDNQVVILSRDVPGQRSLSRDFDPAPRPDTHQGLEIKVTILEILVLAGL